VVQQATGIAQASGLRARTGVVSLKPQTATQRRAPMRVPLWLRPLAARLTRPGTRRARPRPPCCPRLEALEGRDCPSGGLLDPTFNGTGTQTVPDSVAYGATATVVQPDGKVVAVGSVRGANGLAQISVMRLNRDGSLDTTFNRTGSVAIKVAAKAYGGTVALQPDGKILVGGEAYLSQFGYNDSEYAVARLTANGKLDNTFAKSGVFTYNPTSRHEGVSGLAVLGDGSILVGGSSGVAGTNDDAFTVLKLTAGGTFNTAFGSGGVAQVHVGDWDSQDGMAVVPATGQIVLAGRVEEGPVRGSSPPQAALLMLTAAGQPDTSFNGTGYVLDPPSEGAAFNRVAVQGDPTHGYKLVVTGAPQGFQVVGRYTLTGAVDTTFGGAGTGFISFDFSSYAFRELTSLALAQDGSVVIAGTHQYAWDPATNTAYNEMFVAHLSVDGALDTSFGPNGTGISYARPDTFSSGSAVAIDPLGGIVVGGSSSSSLNRSQAAFARFTAP
jgi:uncharacterized delta-60 repeat protein